VKADDGDADEDAESDGCAGWDEGPDPVEPAAQVTNLDCTLPNSVAHGPISDHERLTTLNSEPVEADPGMYLSKLSVDISRVDHGTQQWFQGRIVGYHEFQEEPGVWEGGSVNEKH